MEYKIIRFVLDNEMAMYFVFVRRNTPNKKCQAHRDWVILKSILSILRQTCKPNSYDFSKNATNYSN
jgi:hypothetical protein